MSQTVENRATKPILNTATLSQQVYAHLRAGILDNTYPPIPPCPKKRWPPSSK